MADLKALSHPVRLRLIYALKIDGPMTATQLGKIVDESPASVSYHMRQLAAHGFAMEATDAGGDRRERWWQAAEGGFTFARDDFADSPEAVEAVGAGRRAMIAHQWGRLREYDESSATWSEDWQRAAFASDDLLRLTPDETQLFEDELRNVIDKWRAKGKATAEVDGREPVMLLLHGFPTRP
ncbi:helix-turn-helix domain-containing protein [Antrihabitans cavernicola]|uniref:Helix-turn-helix domain-containing protein n=1 Tax=Antrihabitans cavernicola TaxID=2495913 RepID=A0A5A7SC51_9NOCA|nr:helix-turn-helix domain-containing protein [Spelaeibacter cavernicola]